MANSIDLARHYARVLDEEYAAAAKSSVLNVAPGYVREGDSAGSFYIPQISVPGLGDYSKTTGFPDGAVTFGWEAYTYTQDRGRGFDVDAVDNMETAGLAFGRLAGEFLRTRVVPEIDAYRFSTIADDATATGTEEETLSTSAEWLASIDKGIAYLGDAEVDEGNRVMFINWTGYNALKNSDARYRFSPGGELDRRFESFDGIPVITVPAGRFNSSIRLNTGTLDAGTGGYDTNGNLINLILMDKGAVFADAKHVAPRIFAPSVNQDKDSWLFQYRIYHDCFVLDNKESGIYVSISSTVS